MHGKSLKLYLLFFQSGEIKSRSPSHTGTDWIFCLEVLESPWPKAVGFTALPVSFCTGRTSYFNVSRCRRMDHAAGGIMQVAFDWPNSIILTVPLLLTVE